MAAHSMSEISGEGSMATHLSMWEYLEEGLMKNPDGPAAIVMHQSAKHLAALVDGASPSSHSPQSRVGSNKCLLWTHSQLFKAAARFVNALLWSGVCPGSATIVCFLPNGIEYPLLVWTSILSKCCLCNLDPGALQSPRRAELENLLSTLQPAVIIVPDQEGARAVDETIAKLSMSTPRVKIAGTTAAVTQTLSSEETDSVWSALTSFVLEGSARPVKDDMALKEDAKTDDPDRAAFILFTSGTSTGKPKGVVRTVRTWTYVLSSQGWIATRGTDTRMLIYFANFRISALMFSLQTWCAGGAIVMPSAGFDPELALDAIQQYRGTSLVAIPYQAHSMIDHPKFPTTDVRSVDFVCSGSDTITIDLLKKLEMAFPAARTVGIGHGMTEGGGVLTWTLGRGAEKLPNFGGLLPLGRVSPGAKLRIVDNSTGKLTSRGVPGELHISSAGFVRGYLRGIKPEEFYREGADFWIKTGDLGMITSDGDVFLLGRIKDIIKRAGVPITPAALENCIATNAKALCSVVGVPHPTLGTVPFAVVSHFDTLDENGLKQVVLDEFGPDYALEGAASLQQLGLKQFPLNATDKIMKIELLEPVTRYLLSRA